jgi:hypothetical protein
MIEHVFTGADGQKYSVEGINSGDIIRIDQQNEVYLVAFLPGVIEPLFTRISVQEETIIVGMGKRTTRIARLKN